MRAKLNLLVNHFLTIPDNTYEIIHIYMIHFVSKRIRI